MSGEALITVVSVCLAYRMSKGRANSMKEYAIQKVKRTVGSEKLWALDDVSFQVQRGETFGLIGPNGAGKTTMMKIVARVLPPTSGRVVIRGALAPMISLGAGFNNELTGFENVVLFGTLLGHDPLRMKERAPHIAEWSGLEEFMDVPIRSYSSGMLARLAFAVASDIDPDVLVIDEVLAVGDQAFQKKSFERMQALMDGGTAVLLVSHQLDKVAELADRVLWLDKGHVRMIGDPDEVIDAYKATVA